MCNFKKKIIVLKNESHLTKTKQNKNRACKLVQLHTAGIFHASRLSQASIPFNVCRIDVTFCRIPAVSPQPSTPIEPQTGL